MAKKTNKKVAAAPAKKVAPVAKAKAVAPPPAKKAPVAKPPAKKPGRPKKAAAVTAEPAMVAIPFPPVIIPPPQTVPEGTYTDDDILLPTTNETIAARPANREYIQLLQANSALYHSMPSPEQMWFLTNVCHFLTTVCGRKLINYHPWSGYRELAEPPLALMVAELNLDTFKRAAFQFHPFWLLGKHDPSNFHKGAPFLHRKVDGSWKRATMEDVEKVLQGEGPKNLLLLPTGMEFDEEKLSKVSSPARKKVPKKK